MNQYDPRFPFPPPPPPRQPSNGLGTAGFVVGLIGLLFSWIPIIGVIAWPLVIVGLTLAGVGFAKARSGQATNGGLAIAGIVCSTLGLVVCILYAAAFSAAVSSSASRASQRAAGAPAALDGTSTAQSYAATSAGIGQTVSDGSFTFTVTRVETPGRVLDDGLTSKAQGTWVLVRLTVTNVDNESALFTSARQTLLDAQGREFDADAGAAIMSVKDSDSFLTRINPGNTVNGILVFDVPTGVTPTAIELHGGFVSPGVTVDLTR